MTVHLNLETGVKQILDRGVAVVTFNWDGQRAEYASDRGEPLGRNWQEAVEAAKRLPEERLERVRQSRRKR